MIHVDGEGSNWRRHSLAGEQCEQIHDKNAFVLLEQRKLDRLVLYSGKNY